MVSQSPPTGIYNMLTLIARASCAGIAINGGQTAGRPVRLVSALSAARIMITKQPSISS
jgi:hypothetical protein